MKPVITLFLAALWASVCFAQLDPCSGGPIEDLDQNGIADCVNVAGAVGAGYALDIAGSDAYVELDNAFGIFDLPIFTIEAWIYGGVSSGVNGLTDNPILWKVAEDGANLDCFGLGIEQSGLIRFRYEVVGPDEANNDREILSSTPFYGNPMHICAVYDGSTASLYIDGVLDAQQTFGAETPASGPAGVRVGSTANTNHAGDGKFDGAIDQVRIWNQALPVTSIRQYAAQTSLFGHPELSALISHLRFDEATGSTTVDLASGLDVPITNVTQAHWVRSCARVGDRSVYTAAPLSMISITSTLGDTYNMNPLNPGCDIIFLYTVEGLEDETINYTTATIPVLGNYFGTHCTNALTDMEMRYY